MVQSLTKRPYLFILILGLYLSISLYRLTEIPPPWYDEMAHLNTAVHVAGEGRIWCDFYTNKFKENTLFNSMPLQWLLLGAFIKLFGFSFFGARLFYLLMSAVTLCMLYRLCQRMFGERIALWSVLALAASYTFFHNSRQLIPQVPASMFSVAAVLLFYVAKDKKSGLIMALSGVAAGLAYLSHPIAITAFFALAIVIFAGKVSWKYILCLIMGASIAVIPYIVYVGKNLQAYLYETSFVLKGAYVQQNPFFNLIDEILVRYLGLPRFEDVFLTIKTGGHIYNSYLYRLHWMLTSLNLPAYACEVARNMILLISLIYIFAKRKKSAPEKDLVIITLTGAFILAVHPNKFGPYIYTGIPYFSICFALMINDFTGGLPSIAHNNSRRPHLIISLLLVSAFIVSNPVYIFKEISTKKVKAYFSFAGEIMEYVPAGSSVAGPAYFWLGLRTQYKFTSANEIVYAIDRVLKERRAGAFGRLPYGEQSRLIREIFARHGIKYVLLTPHYWDDITEVPDDAYGFGEALRKYLFYNSDKVKDYLHEIYYTALPAASSAERELYSPPPPGFNNVSAEYQEGLKIYRLR